MKVLISKNSHVRAELGINDINPGDVCRLYIHEEDKEHILIAIPHSKGTKCSRCAVSLLGIRTCYTGCSRRGFYFRRIDNVMEDL